MEEEHISYDIVIVGAGPAGLSAAIRLKQLAPDLSVCVLEKGSDVGAHILSGAVLEPRALDELIPDWRDRKAPITQAVINDRFCLLTKNKAWRLPTPPLMHNQGNYIISLGKLCRWLASQAEDLGVEIFTSFSCAELLIDDNDHVRGVKTTAQGIHKNSEHKAHYQAGICILAKQTLLAEGARGSLSEQAMHRLNLRAHCDPQSYGLGIKEIWEVPGKNHQPGHVLHTIGWPLDNKTYGGSFIYHIDNEKIALGFVVGLDYHNPYLDPYEELQRFKTHPAISPLLAGGERIRYGARTLNEGGWQSIPKMSFKGGLLLGASAGMMNVAKIKGTHTAMKSAIIAAEVVVKAHQQQSLGKELRDYHEAVLTSWAGQELHRSRNIRPAFRWGLWPGLAYSALDTYLLRGRAPWTLHHYPDHEQLQLAAKCQPIDYPKHDGKLTFDKLNSLSFSNVAHEEDQPVHLQLREPALAIDNNWVKYQSPEQRYCPAGVYEIIQDGNEGPRLQINAQNCIHCKCCDIKDPKQNIHWVPPEGGGGPNYPDM